MERHLLIEGGSGGGKTVSVMAIALKLVDQMMAETEARMMEGLKIAEEENPPKKIKLEVKTDQKDNITEGNNESVTHLSPVLIISGHLLDGESQLLQHLKDLTKGLSCLCRVLGWQDLLDELEVEEDDECDNLPLTIVSLAQALSAQYKGRQVVLILDELQGNDAPVTGSPEHSDLSSLTGAVLPDNVRLLCCMNPTNDLPLLLTPCQPSFVTVNSKK